MKDENNSLQKNQDMTSLESNQNRNEELIDELNAMLEDENSEEIVDRSVAKTLSPGMLVLKRFFRSKLSVAGVIILVCLFLFSFLGPLFSPWGETEIDETNGKTFFTAVEITVVGDDGTEYIVYDVVKSTLAQNQKAPPSAEHWLGTDQNGRDVLTRLMYGGRISLTLGFAVVFLQTAIGVILGGLAGYFGKAVDMIVMRVVDIFSCVPTLPLLLIASAVLDSNSEKIPPTARIYILMMLLTIFGWVGTARMVRGQILSLREQEFMIAAEATGLPVSRKIFRHLVPNVMPQLLVSMTLSLGGIILSESTLSYLGLGVPIPKASWGIMISASSDPTILANFFNIWVPPGVLIVLAVLAFNFIGDGLRDAFDPKMKR